MKASSAVTMLMLTAVLAVQSGCGRAGQTGKPQGLADGTSAGAAKIPVAIVRAAGMAEKIEVPAEIEGYETAPIMARLEGYVAEVRVDIGDLVEPGQVLAVLDVPELLAEVERREKLVDKAIADRKSREAETRQADALLAQLEAQQKLRKIQLTRFRGLVRGGSLEQEKVDEAQYALESVIAGIRRAHADISAAQQHVHSAMADIEVAQAELKKAQAMAGYLQIRAPFDGLITQRNIDSGAFVRPPSGGKEAQPLFMVERVEKLRVVLHVPMVDAGKLDVGDAVQLHNIQGLPQETVRGTIARSARAFHRGTRMMRAEIDLENPSVEETGKRRFRPGAYGKVTLTLHRYQDDPAVPETAVGSDSDGNYVMLIDQSNQCVLRRVNVQFKKDGLAVLSNSIRVGDRVVADQLDRVQQQQQLTDDMIELIK